MVIGLSGVQFTEGVIGRVISIWSYEHDYPWIVRHEVLLPINCLKNKMHETLLRIIYCNLLLFLFNLLLISSIFVPYVAVAGKPAYIFSLVLIG